MATEFLAYDPTTTLGKVRALIRDKDQNDFLFSDQELNAFLTLENQNIWLAAATALDAAAVDHVLALKVAKVLDITVDGAKVADALSKQANKWREMAGKRDSTGAQVAGFAYSENAHTVFGERELEDRILDRT